MAALRRARKLYTLKGASLPLHRVNALLTGVQALADPTAAQPADSGRTRKSIAVSRRS